MAFGSWNQGLRSDSFEEPEINQAPDQYGRVNGRYLAPQKVGEQWTGNGLDRAGNSLQRTSANKIAGWQDYLDPSQVKSDFSRPLYQQYVDSLGGKSFEETNMAERAALARYAYGDRSSLTGKSLVDYGLPIMATLITGGVAAGLGAGSGVAGAGGAGGTTSAASAFPGLSVAGGTGATGLGGTALTGTLGTGIAAPTIGAGLSVGGSAIPAALGATGASGMGMGITDWLSLGGDALDAYGQYQAAGQQEDMMRQGLAANAAAAEYAKGAYNPYMQAGLGGLAGLQGMSSYDPTTDPMYQQQLAEMTRMMDSRSAAMGMGQSSADLKSRAAAGAGLWGDAFNRRLGLNQMMTGLGQYGTTGAANAAIGQGNTAGNYLTGIGAQQAAQTSGMYGGLGQAFQLPALRQEQGIQNQMMTDYIQAMNRGY